MLQVAGTANSSSEVIQAVSVVQAPLLVSADVDQKHFHPGTEILIRPRPARTYRAMHGDTRSQHLGSCLRKPLRRDSIWSSASYSPRGSSTLSRPRTGTDGPGQDYAVISTAGCKLSDLDTSPRINMAVPSTLRAPDIGLMAPML